MANFNIYIIFELNHFTFYHYFSIFKRNCFIAYFILEIYDAHQLNLQYNPTAEHQLSTFLFALP